jgi:UDP-3-O-[3-hydroxymyristoyl] glucosamine N-acyltransferase
LPYKYVVGSGRELQRAMAAWREAAPEFELRGVELDAKAGRGALEKALEAALDGVELAGATAFVAGDAHFLNFRRLELVDVLRERGVAMPPLVERGAIVGAGVEILENTWIGAGAIIQPGGRIGANAAIGAGAIVGGFAEIGESAFVDAGVTIGHGAKIGKQATLGLGVIVGHGVGIGELCVIDKPGRIDADVAAKTFIQSSHAHPMVIVGE